MHQSGITPEGRAVIAGIFSLVGTHGVPLEIVLYKLKNEGLVADWVDYIKSALADGHNLGTIKARISAAVGDVYGSSYKKQVEFRLEKII